MGTAGMVDFGIIGHIDPSPRMRAFDLAVIEHEQGLLTEIPRTMPVEIHNMFLKRQFEYVMGQKLLKELSKSSDTELFFTVVDGKLSNEVAYNKPWISCIAEGNEKACGILSDVFFDAGLTPQQATNAFFTAVSFLRDDEFITDATYIDEDTFLVGINRIAPI